MAAEAVGVLELSARRADRGQQEDGGDESKDSNSH